MKHLFAFLLIFFLTSAVNADEISFVKKAYEVLSKTTKQNADAQAEKASELFDFGLLFDKATMDIRAHVPDADHARLKALFTDLLKLQMEKKADRLIGRQVAAPHFTKEKKENVSVIRLTGTADKSKVNLVFFVMPAKTGFRITDLEVNSVLLSRNYRGQFNKIFRMEGVAGMEARLLKKKMELES